MGRVILGDGMLFYFYCNLSLRDLIVIGSFESMFRDVINVMVIKDFYIECVFFLIFG